MAFHSSRCWGPLCLTVALALSSVATAGELIDESLGHRLVLALDRGSAYSDVIGLSASMAYPYGSSANPAAGDFLREPPSNYTVSGTGTGAFVALGGGGSVSAGAASFSARVPGAGTVIAAYSRIDSHDATTHQGDRITVRIDELRLSYSQLILPTLSVGVSVRGSESELSIGSTMFDFPLRTTSGSLSGSAGVGVLWKPATEWLLGGLAELGWSRSRTHGAVDFPAPPFGPGPGPIAFTDNTRSVNLRLGGGWRPSESLGVYADVQYLHLDTVLIGAGSDRAEIGRAFAGVEYLPIQALALRLGGSADSDRQLTLSAGIGFYPTRYLQAELAYVYNALPELRREFGRAHLVSVSVAVVFFPPRR